MGAIVLGSLPLGVVLSQSCHSWLFTEYAYSLLDSSTLYVKSTVRKCHFQAKVFKVVYATGVYVIFIVRQGNELRNAHRYIGSGTEAIVP